MPLYEAILIATLTLTGWFAYKGSQPFGYFLPFMVLVVVVELYLESWYYKTYGTNYPVMNLYAKACIFYYLFVFYEYFKENTWAPKLKYGIIAYVIFTLVMNFWFHDHSTIDYISYNLGYLILLPMMLMYLHEVIYKRSYFNIFQDPYFYFVFGLLIFYTSGFPILGFINILITDNPDYDVYFKLLNIGNIFLSLAYLGAALCSRPRTPSTISS